MASRRFAVAIVALLVCSATASGQSLYKYQDENGSWIYSDRPPANEQPVEIRELPIAEKPPKVTVTSRLAGRQMQLVARNDNYIPVEVVIALDQLTNLEFPHPEQAMRWVVDARSELMLLDLAAINDNQAPGIQFRYVWLPGRPDAVHAPLRPYRAPFAVARNYRISQAFPLGETHTTPNSYHAVDIAMPIGTDVYAARDGIVFEVASTNFQGGLNLERDAETANIVRIMHDDGSHAVYGHLNWNSIRVRPGDRVKRGQYIADSGNTGFTSGPHLHFAVMLNRGMRLESVPIQFEGPNSLAVEPMTGNILFAY